MTTPHPYSPDRSCEYCTHRVCTLDTAPDPTTIKMAALGWHNCALLPLDQYFNRRAQCCFTPSRFDPHQTPRGTTP